MRFQAVTVVVCLFFISPEAAPPAHSKTPTEEEEIHQLKQTIESLARQLMGQQLLVEESIRNDGDSGIKAMELGRVGSRPYYADSFTGPSVMRFYDRAHTENELGLGFLHAVMNGVEFRTGTSISRLKMPSTKNKNFNELENIPFPDVPPSVNAKGSLAEKIREMQEYFRAFKNQDKQIRNYEPYFKPVLCYLEAGWHGSSHAEPMQPNNYMTDIKNWFNSQEHTRMFEYTGGVDIYHRYPFQPTKVIDVKNGTPIYAQWKYRYACHPIKQPLHLFDLSLIDDFGVRLSRRKTLNEFALTPSARFRVTGRHGSHYNANMGVATETPRYYSGLEFIDQIMQEIPGKDNYPGYLSDESFGMYHDNLAYRNNTRLNTAYYHRIYKVEKKDAMGVSIVNRGFHDTNLWTAQTTRSQIAPMSITDCVYDRSKHKKVCTDYKTRYTYAIPIEIVWLTPLHSWNPYGIQHHEGPPNVKPGNIILANGRNGGMTRDKAYNGTNVNHFYRIPLEFYFGDKKPHRNTRGVLDKMGNLRNVTGSGVRILTPNIPHVGVVRMRYPIAHVHSEGNTVKKELDALKEMFLDIPDLKKYYEKDPSPLVGEPKYPNEHFKTSTTHKSPPGQHNHDVYITHEEMMALSHHKTVTAFTSTNKGHQHQLDMKIDSNGHYIITQCDHHPTCTDGHTNHLYHQNH